MKTLKGNTLMEEFFKYWLTTPNLTSSDACNWWLSKFDELERRIREERAKQRLKYNAGLDRALDILNEMRGEK